MAPSPFTVPHSAPPSQTYLVHESWAVGAHFTDQETEAQGGYRDGGPKECALELLVGA